MACCGRCSLVSDPPDGFTPGRVWDDIADFDSLPTGAATHATQDTQLFSAASPTLHTAIVSPSFVMRPTSRAHRVPIILPYLLRAVRDIDGGFVSGEGKNVTAFVDNAVLAGIYVALVADALRAIRGGEVNDEVWGPRAYYFASSLEVSFREFMESYLLASLKRSGEEGLLKSDGIKEMPQEEIAKDPVAERKNAFHYAVEHTASGRRLFVTANGYIHRTRTSRRLTGRPDLRRLRERSTVRHSTITGSSRL